MILASIISGAGATQQMDGWHACGPLSCFGALSSGDIELLEYQYPILIHKYGLAEDSGGAGEYRGGCGTVWEVEPLDHTMTVIAFGEGRQHPTMGAGGAEQISPELKVGRLEILHKDGQTDLYRKNTVTEITDVKERTISISAAKIEYGVVIDPETLALNEAETEYLRRQITA